MAFAFIFDSIGGTEWLVLLGVILIVVGPKNLPAAARKFGEISAQLRRAADEFKRQLLSMDQEIRSTVDEAVKSADYVETPKDSDDDPSKKPDDASVDDGGDRAETENDYYGYDGSYDDGNPYPGHEYYDDTQADDGTKGDAAVAEAPKAESDAQTATADSQPVKPKVDPYAINITVSTDADRNKKGAKA